MKKHLLFLFTIIAHNALAMNPPKTPDEQIIGLYRMYACVNGYCSCGSTPCLYKKEIKTHTQDGKPDSAAAIRSSMAMRYNIRDEKK